MTTIKAGDEVRGEAIERTAQDIARNIVNQLGDLWEVDPTTRQATNDEADAFVTRLIAAAHERLHQQVQQARKDYYEQAIGHGEKAGHEEQEARAYGRVEMCDEVLGWLTGTPADSAGHPVTSRCECGGLARHIEQCRWRQGYGSHVISPAPEGER